MRSVVVTGIGLVTPLGWGASVSWKKLVESESGVRSISSFDSSDISSRVAGEVPQISEADSAFVERLPSQKESRKMDRFVLLGMAAAAEAIEDSGWSADNSEEAACRTGVFIGAGIGGLPEIARTAVVLHEKGPSRVSPFFVPSSIINMVSGNVSIKYGFKGPNSATATACASGTHAIGDAANLIRLGYADVMIAGGAEAAVCRIGVAGFAAARALSTGFNDFPDRASRPWDRDRDGFVIGEGSGILVLEEEQHARLRGARIYAKISGYGMSGDAYHITAPSETGDGAYRCMKSALENAKMAPSDVDYINAHGTSTPAGDKAELAAVERLFCERLSGGGLCMSSTKSSVGHLLGAAGSVEAGFSILALQEGVVPPTLNLDNPEKTYIDLVPKIAQKRRLKVVMSNSFGFGGTNASLVFQKY
ncbi:beta-ketoacyl-ACP synthase II [Candidatus Hydrogenosomobacter endosymbioticus]|uniref:3-oxoacyl-[acyl-carrier-protein] synthase 2 n=1 Tax=Candidatus Hydrogenosomobacter endosymbioticus TaxID=2558174 RepID=A0ABM7V8H6_9PROT|nr:beta-ketoacyl-ACP synthase II [Candidatus Hydrogenosomobacter endosymbioticus]BDB96087.1 3-oxoacyl-[acyl-carrier-protein] synthase 2 [Candidatus Hydrogenosomobacter endosymbioticus]